MANSSYDYMNQDDKYSAKLPIGPTNQPPKGLQPTRGDSPYTGAPDPYTFDPTGTPYQPGGQNATYNDGTPRGQQDPQYSTDMGMSQQPNYMGDYGSSYDGYKSGGAGQGVAPRSRAGMQDYMFGRGEGQMNPWDQGKWTDDEWSKMIGDDMYEKLAFPYWDREQRDYQFGAEMEEGQRRFDAGYGLDRQDLEYNQWANQRDYGEDTRRWDKQYGFQDKQWGETRDILQQERDTESFRANTEAELARTEDLYKKGLISNQEYANKTERLNIDLEHTAAMDANMATRYSADQYSGAQRYGADQVLAGTQYRSDAEREASMYGADQGLAGTKYSADQYSGAQRYAAAQELVGTRYRSDAELAGTRYSADKYSGAQRYGADQQLAGTRYQSELGLQGTLGSAGIYAGAQRYGSDVEARTAAARLAQEKGQMLSRGEQMAIEEQRNRSMEQQSRWQAFGHAQAPNARWARSYG